jgi:hypothetical protein
MCNTNKSTLISRDAIKRAMLRTQHEGVDPYNSLAAHSVQLGRVYKLAWYNKARSLAQVVIEPVAAPVETDAVWGASWDRPDLAE